MYLENLSSFPQRIDTFEELYDLPPNKVVQAKRFQELKAKPTLNANEQAELNNLIVELGSYIITPQHWNKFASALVNMQQFITDEVQGYLEDKQKLWATYVNNFRLVGNHDSQTAYKFQNMVKSDRGDLHIATQDVPAGIDIENKKYWTQISSKGDKGDTGLNVYYKGAYSDDETYSLGDAVTIDGNMYYVKDDTVAGESPLTNPDKWFLETNTIVSEEKPTISQKGLVWIEVIE